MNLSAIPLEDTELDRLLVLVRKYTGINMNESKRQLIAGRLGKRLRELGLSSFTDYCNEVCRPGSPELERFINSVTTNLTSFFREPHHFEHLAVQVLPALRRPGRGSRIRVWSAGCSTGLEPYSIAMVMHDVLGTGPGCDWRILATDLDSDVLAQAREGVYAASQAENVPENFRKRYLAPARGGESERVRVRDSLRERVVFKQLNLMDRWPMKGPLDVIFCRNVGIYFDKPTQIALFDRFADLLTSDGTLYIGHSESLYQISDRFRLVGQSTYLRTR